MSVRKRASLVGLCSIVPLVLGGCLSSGGGSSSKAPDPAEPGAPDSTFVALFNPATEDLPFPTNLPFLGTEDGTLNIPVDGLEGSALVLASQMNEDRKSTRLNSS